MSVCSYCGAEIAEDVNFCTTCGAAVERATAVVNPVEEQAYQPPVGQSPAEQPPVEQPSIAQQPYQSPAEQQAYQPPAEQQPYQPAGQQPYQPPAGQQPYQQQPYQQPYQQPFDPAQQAQQPNVQQPVYGMPQQAPVEDSGSIGWAILGFIIPIVGIVLFFVWRNTKPESAKMSIIGAAVSVALALVFNVFFH